MLSLLIINKTMPLQELDVSNGLPGTTRIAV